jgi:hypothetical protein
MPPYSLSENGVLGLGFWGFGFGLKYHPGFGVWVFLWFVVFGFFFGL